MQKVIAGLLAVIAVFLGVFLIQNQKANGGPDLGSGFNAVVLNGGQVFFGRVDHSTAQYAVLKDVFYIQSQANPDTKQVTNILIRRGKEWHGPEQMLINRQSILFIEPVKEDSQVAKLIADQLKQAK